MNKLFIVDYMKDGCGQGNSVVTLCKVDELPNGDFKDVRFTKMSESDLVRYMGSNPGKVVNFGLGDGFHIRSLGYEFECFENKVKPSVIANNIKTKAGNLIGYTILRHDGRHIRIKLGDAIRLACEAKQMGCVAFQNYMLVSETREKKAHLRSFNGVAVTDFILQESVSKIDPSRLKRAEVVPEAKDKENALDNEQLKQLKLGKEHGINYRAYMNPKLSGEQMKWIRIIAESGFNPAYLAFPEYSVDSLKFYVTDYKQGADIRYYLSPKYNPAQLFQLSLGVVEGVNIKEYKNPNISSLEMEEIRNRLSTQLWKDVRCQIESKVK